MTREGRFPSLQTILLGAMKGNKALSAMWHRGVETAGLREGPWRKVSDVAEWLSARDFPKSRLIRLCNLLIPKSRKDVPARDT